MTVIASTPSEVSRYQIIVIKHALAIYASTGMKVNRAYTPKNMMAMAEKITGKTFKARDYRAAVAALEVLLGQLR